MMTGVRDPRSLVSIFESQSIDPHRTLGRASHVHQVKISLYKFALMTFLMKAEVISVIHRLDICLCI